jgi:HlyD family secretion protein
MNTAIEALPGLAVDRTPRRGHRGARIAAALLALAVAGTAAYLLARRRLGQGSAPPRFHTARVTTGSLEARVTATGTLSALVTVQVGSQVSGRVQELLADYNSPVRKGQLLARIDPRLFAAALEQARANELAARASLERFGAQAFDAERQLGRGHALVGQGVIGQQELDGLDAAARAAAAQVKAGRAGLVQATAVRHQAELNLAFTEILSPIDGVVISRNVDVGQTVAAAFQSPTLFLLAEDLARMQVDTSVAEADVGRLRPGMSARFSVDAYPSETFVGTVRQIRNAPQTVQNVVTYDAVIDVVNPEQKLRPGMTANVTFVYASRRSAVLVPNAALRFRPSGPLAAQLERPSKRAADQRTVWVLEAGKPRPVTLRPGVSDGTLTEVLDGLAAGAEVITDVAAAARTSAGAFGRVL